MNLYRNYQRLYTLVYPLVRLFYPYKTYGVENIPKGAAVLCPLHSNLTDPFIVAVAMGREHTCRPLAKEESLHIPIMSWIMKTIGSIFVRRGESDIEAYKSCIRALKGGDKLLAFPEGTRVHGGEEHEAKTGVIRMAAKTNTPIVPVYLPRDKKLFHRINVVFGEPYFIENARHDDYERLAQELMDKIWALKK